MDDQLLAASETNHESVPEGEANSNWSRAKQTCEFFGHLGIMLEGIRVECSLRLGFKASNN